MKSRKKVVIRILVLILFLIVCSMLFLIHTRASNAEAFDRQINNPEKLFHGVFNTETGANDIVGILNGDEICVIFSNDNLDYDEKHLTFTDAEKGTGESFNFYSIKPAGKNPGQVEDPKKLETTWYLCEYDGGNSLVFLSADNKEIGRLSFTISKEDWLGKKILNYYWLTKEKTTAIYKRADTPYMAGTAYLKSKYYSGIFLDK